MSDDPELENYLQANYMPLLAAEFQEKRKTSSVLFLSIIRLKMKSQCPSIKQETKQNRCGDFEEFIYKIPFFFDPIFARL